MKMLALVILMIPLSAPGQLSRQDSIWRPLAALIGSWEGTGGGEPGIGKYERTYAFIFGKKFIEIRNKSTYPPTAKNPKGEVHEDVGYMSYDKARRKFILRQFHIEGFVNQYALDSLSSDGSRFTFISEAIENIENGWRAKESYQIQSENKFTETFELAAPDKPFDVYTRVTLHRTK